jgi:hypothetical protein
MAVESALRVLAQQLGLALVRSADRMQRAADHVLRRNYPAADFALDVAEWWVDMADVSRGLLDLLGTGGVSLVPTVIIGMSTAAYNAGGPNLANGTAALGGRVPVAAILQATNLGQIDGAVVLEAGNLTPALNTSRDLLTVRLQKVTATAAVAGIYQGAVVDQAAATPTVVATLLVRLT